MPQQLNQVPPNLEVWDVAGEQMLVRVVDEFGLDPPLYLFWTIGSAEEAEALGISKVDRFFGTREDWYRVGALNMGNNRELVNTTEDPIDQIISNYETEVRVKPWLADPEILALWTGSALEGRSISDAELFGTEWWRTHTEGERQWLAFYASDPATAEQFIQDNRARVAELFRTGGVDNAPQDLINTVADQWTAGKWSEIYATNQIRMLADPMLTGSLDPLLSNFRDGLDSTRAGEETVRALLDQWLGPAYSRSWDESAIQRWASIFRENPDAKLELEDQLRKHRLALFPEYTDPNLTYEDIAGPWRGVFRQVWGSVPDETDSLFLKIVRMNDMGAAEQMLRKEGLTRGNSLVTQDLMGDLVGAFGSGIVRSDPAIL